MKRFKLLILAVLCLPVIFLAGCQSVVQRANSQDTWSKIERQKKVVIGLDDSFVPMGFREKSGKLVGYDVDLARAVFKQYGIKVDFQPIDWSMKETELRNGTIDLLWNGYSVTPERAKKVAFSRSYLQNQQVLVTKKSYGVKTFADMKGKTLGVQNGSTGQNELNAQPKLLKDFIKGKTPVLYDTFPNAFIDLNVNRIQGLLMDKVYAEYYIRHQKNRKDFKVIVNPNFEVDDFAVGLRKGDKTLKKKIDQGLGRLQKSGQLEKINDKWFGTSSNYLGK